jgi:ADP-L-glycero-D-manno-heptose 6-epimerase
LADDLLLVTGAGGFIGSNIACALAQNGAGVVVSDHFRHRASWQYLASALLHDVIAPENVLPWLHDHSDRVAGIIHMGAVTSTTETDLVKIIAGNVRFTLDLWEFSAVNGNTFIYASSAATYGDGSHGFVDDDSPAALARLRPLNAYAWSKHLVDRRIVDDVTAGRPAPPRWAGLKLFNVYGPNEGHKGQMRSVVHQIYPLAASGLPVKLFKSDNPRFPDGGQLRDFVYVHDCCAVVTSMLAAPTISGLFNVGTGVARSFADLARAVFQAMDREPRIEYVDMPGALRDRYQYFTEADTRKLRANGLAPPFHTLESGVAEYVRGHLVHELG